MPQRRLANDSVHWFVDELTSRIVAETGIPSDRYHLGKIILQSFKDAPDFVMQIDGVTGESETFGSALKRTVRCASCLRNLGLGHGDVMILMAPNHLDIAIPLYAALYLGVIVAPIDWTDTKIEIQQSFAVFKPKIVFSQYERVADVQLALKNLNLDAQIVTIGKEGHPCSFTNFMEKYGDDTSVNAFKAADFHPEDSTAFLVSTGGTTGIPKAATLTYKNLAISTSYIWERYTVFPTPTRLTLIGTPLQWMTAIMLFIASPIFRVTSLHTSKTFTEDHLNYLFDTYKPTYSILNPSILAKLIKPDDPDEYGFTSLELLHLAGNIVPQNLINKLKNISSNTEILNMYGMSEVSGFAFQGDNPTSRSCGKAMGCFQYRIVNIETQEDINEPNMPGELWLKGPTVFKGYHSNDKATEETFSEDHWFKTGDIFYRDENWNFYFVERIKLMMLGISCWISPAEIEAVILQHPGVLDVAVTGVPDAEYCDIPFAFVVPHPGTQLSAQEIKDLVKDNLSDSKQLRGGVKFIDAIPVKATGKIDRRKLKQMSLEHRE